MLEAGLLLILIPWSAFWDRNYFSESLPALGSLLTNNFVRGGVSGLGVLNLLAAVGELADLFYARPPAVPEASGELGDHHAP